jgi:hypothetical protein
VGPVYLKKWDKSCIILHFEQKKFLIVNLAACQNLLRSQWQPDWKTGSIANLGVFFVNVLT